jgi:glycerophosphoryl diester phosphodiesterase
MTLPLISGVGLALSLLPSVPRAPVPGPRHRVAVIAHRGGTSLAPENTLAAFRRAAELGVDYVEIDVRATRDGRLVLMHDRTVDRTTDGTGAVADLDYAAITSLHAGGSFAPAFAGERVPTLDDALRLCRGKVGIYLDHKDGSILTIVRAIRKHRMTRQVVVYDGPEEVREWKRLAPGIPVMISPGDEARAPGGLARLRAGLPVDILDGNVVEWTQAMVDEAHANGMLVYVDNLGLLDNWEGLRRAIEMGVDGIQTDYPDRLLEVLRSPPSGG